MARKALLVWCAGSVLACGTAALAATTLWRAPAKAVDTSAAMPDLPPIAEPAALAGLDFPPIAEGFLSLASVSFFAEPAGSQSLLRGTLATSPLPVLPEPESTGFVELRPPEPGADHRLAVRPPPRPAALFAALDATRTPTAQGPADVPVPGFEVAAPIPQSSPSFDWGGLLGTPTSGTPARVINSGVASWYGPGFHGRKTASGERFDQNDMTAAHRTLPFGTRVRVIDEKTGRSVVVRINDRGPFKHSRVIDLSKAAAQVLGAGGLTRVKVVSAN